MRAILCGHGISVQFAGGSGVPHAVHIRPNARRTEHPLPDRKCPGGLYRYGNWPTDYPRRIASVLFAPVRPALGNRLPARWNRRLLKHLYAEYDFQFGVQLVSSKLGETILERAAVYGVLHRRQVVGQ